MKHTEVERKFRVADIGGLRARLADFGGVWAGERRQVDTYYNHPGRDFLAGFSEGAMISEWLRVRDDYARDGGCVASINFKQWLPVGAARATHANEFESVVADRDSVGALLEALGFTELVRVDKRRECWHLDDVEVALDHVVGLGDFVEFEYAGGGQLVDANAAISDVVGRCEGLLGEQDHRGYPYLLLGR